MRTNRVVGEDTVAGEIEFTGTNAGPMQMGGNEIPPTGKSVHGKAPTSRRSGTGDPPLSTYPDIAGLMMQLGLM